MNLRKLFAALLAALLLIGACGGDDDSDDAATDKADQEASDTTEDESDESSGDDNTDDTDLSDLDDVAGLDEDCLTASGAAISLGLMPLMFAFAPMGEAFTDDTLITPEDIDEMQSSIDDLQSGSPTSCPTSRRWPTCPPMPSTTPSRSTRPSGKRP